MNAVPSFTPNPGVHATANGADLTGPFPAAVRPYTPVTGNPLDPTVPVFAAAAAAIEHKLLGGRLWGPLTRPSEPKPGNSPVLYCGPGWPTKVYALRRRDGEFEDYGAIAERGLGLNVAAERTAYRHSREQMVQRAMDLCESLGWQDMTAELLRRVEQFNAAAAQAREASAA
jgi:hypothetical protein